jgi:3-oxoacyl-[acyl-carrier protein] reductase
MIDLTGKTALITGGTMGIGLATGLAYAQAGANTVLTYRWGTADLDQVKQKFRNLKGPEPLIVEADVAEGEDTTALLDAIARKHDSVDFLISNVAFALRTSGPDDYSLRSLFRSIEYSAWPMFTYTQAIKDRFGRYPKYVVGLSSDGPDGFFMNYDFVAMTKSVLETMCRYMNFRLFDHGVKVNVVRSRLVRTESFDATFGGAFHDFLESLGGFEDCYTEPADIANAILALTSGLMDAVGGQVLMVDKGFEFFDNLMGIAERQKTRPPKGR